MTTMLELTTRSQWSALPYQAHTACATCGAHGYCCGLNPESRVCVDCFDVEHAGRAPNYRRRHGRRQTHGFIDAGNRLDT